MRTHVFLGAILVSLCTIAQSPWVLPGNNGTDPTNDYLGTDDGKRLTIRTDDSYRMQVNETETNTIGSFTLMPCDGFVGISPSSDFWSGTYKTPFSRLHLAEGSGDNEQALGYRPWQRNGISLTGNADQGYLGQKFSFEDPTDHESGELEDYTDIVIQWSDNPGKWLKDRLRFIFTSAYDESATGAGSLEGLEGMRLFPADDDNVNVGIGDWYAANVNSSGAITEPEERLDIVDGNVRIRELPTLSPTAYDKVMVVDDDGVVHWRPASDFDECDWVVTNETTSGSTTVHNVYTAVGSDPLCPDGDDAVGIGTNTPSAKLHVEANTVTNELPTTGVYVHLQVDTDEGGLGVHAKLEPDDGSADSQVGVLGEVYNSTLRQSGVSGIAVTNGDISVYDSNVGVYGSSNITDGTVDLGAGLYSNVVAGSGSAVNKNAGLFTLVSGTGSTNSYGVKADVIGGTTNYGAYLDAWSTATTNYGLWTRGSGATNNYGVYTSASGGTTNWALYVNGAQFSSTLATFTTSDPALKTNIEDANVQDAAEILSAVELHTYEFNPSACPQMQMPEGEQLGVLSPELASILPGFVREARQPAEYDAEGVEVHPAVDFQAVNYPGFIPYLIAGYQAQQALLDEQAQRLDALEEALNNCCNNNMQLQGDGATNEVVTGVSEETILGNTRPLSIEPNPFSEPPTVLYTLERAGRMQLIANSADGKQLSLLRDAALEAGDFQLVWDTSSLQPGMYYLTLLLDGEPVVKKAVKVGR